LVETPDRVAMMMLKVWVGVGVLYESIVSASASDQRTEKKLEGLAITTGELENSATDL
jgi:hypothetical protein